MIRSGSGSDSAFWHSLLLFIILLIILWSSAHAACYFPNGTDRNTGLSDEVYQPCGPGDEHSMCCALNRPAADKCRNDGLCLAVYIEGLLWRESCTDPTWKSPRCIKLCDSGTGQFIEGFDIDLAANDQTITNCNDGSYCCGNGTLADACCSENKGLFVVNGTTVPRNPNSSVSETALSSPTNANLSPSSRDDLPHSLSASTLTTFSEDLLTSTPSTSSSSSTPSTSSSSAAQTSNKTGVIVGGTIGGAAVLALIAGTIALIWMYRNNRNPQGHGIPQATWTGQSVDELYRVPENNGINELDAENHGINELDAPRPLPELENSTISHKRQII